MMSAHWLGEEGIVEAGGKYIGRSSPSREKDVKRIEEYRKK